MRPHSQSTDASLTTAYAGRPVTVMGLGHFGGGLGAVKFLARHGARVTVTDLQSADQLAQPLLEIQGLPHVRMVLGRHRDEDFTHAELVVASPAIRPDHPCLEVARDRGVPVTTEIGLFWRHCPAPVIGVTGTVGKSTTSALIHHLLTANGCRAWLGGNIGGSLLEQLSEIQPNDSVVLELSSFQLMYLDRQGCSPHIAVVTNLTPNHLNWHTSLDEYRQAKQTLLRHQRANDFAILPGWNESVTGWDGPARRVIVDADDILPGSPQNSLLPGQHSRRNAAMAIAAAVAAGVDRSACIAALRSFRGLPHRLEFVAEYQGRRLYNDSKATTPEAAIAALQAFDSPLVVLAGGSDKHIDLGPFAAELKRRAKAVALMGDSAARLNQLLSAESDATPAPLRQLALDFRDAFDWAMSQSDPGDIILLSPGCASFGWFRDYVDRGEQFRTLVGKLGE